MRSLTSAAATAIFSTLARTLAPITPSSSRRWPGPLATTLTLLALLSACTNTPTQTDKPKPELLKTWEIKGKMGYRSSQGNGSALLYWRQKNSHYHLNLSGPFGTGNININGNLTHATISEGQSRPRSVEVESLDQTLGFNIPLEQLQYWIQGQTAPGSPVTQLKTSQNRAESFKQDDWTVSYRRYSAINGRNLPTKIVIEQDQAKLTLIIKNWTI